MSDRASSPASGGDAERAARRHPAAPLLLSVALLAAAAAVGLSSARAQDRAATPAHGTWLTENGKAIVEIGDCGERLCGKIVWMREPLGPDGEPKRDGKNADAALRARPIMGLDMLADFRPAGPGVWTDGTIYSPEDGDTYASSIELETPDRLKVRGCVWILCKSQTWRRTEIPL